MILVLSTMADAARAANPADELEQLLFHVASGNQQALGQLYQRTRTAIYSLALSYLKNGAEAEDITQDTFVQVWNNASNYRSKGKPMAWLLTITRNLCLMRMRKQQHVQDITPEQWESFAIESPHITAEDRAILTAALTVLTEEERRIVVLHAVSGLKHREIATLLNLALPTVLSKYHRALKKLKTTLQGDDEK